MLYIAAMYIVVCLQLIIPIYLFIGHTLTIIISTILYFLVFAMLGNSIEVTLWLTFLFLLVSPYLRIPLYQHLKSKIITNQEDNNSMIFRLRNYFIPF